MDQTAVLDASKSLPSRRAMVDNQIRTFDVTDQRLLDRFSSVPREVFLPSGLADLAYSDAALTVASATGGKRAMLVPLVLARLLQGASIRPEDRILVVGDASGYATAIVAGLAAEAVMIEADAGFVEQAVAAFGAIGIGNATAKRGALPAGDTAGAPYDVIVVQGAIEAHHEQLAAQLAPRGRMVAIRKMQFDGVRRSGKAVLIERFGDDVSARTLFDGTAPVLEGFEEAASFTF